MISFLNGGILVIDNETKVCTKCQIEKSRNLFSARKKSKDGLASWCRNCFQISWKQRYYENHRHYRDSHARSRNKLREEYARKVFEYLENHPCIMCGESDPIVLEFDHRDRNDKIESVSVMTRNSSWERIEFEIQKCDVLCANCHRRKTAAQFGYKRHIFVNV
ncbi:MAG: hypothetical protein LH614_13135 [Pyrinomonadaceae bacterium]|nr:hypothetical protein [Pyrinomonadaceae bacterium]